VPPPLSKEHTEYPKKWMNPKFGSIVAGGRYDTLVSAFVAGSVSSNPNSKEYKKALANSIPCVGVSIGMDRIFGLVCPRYLEKGARTKYTMVFVMSAGDGLLEKHIELVRESREVQSTYWATASLRRYQCSFQIQVDFLAKAKSKLGPQFAADEVPFAVILGADELQSGVDRQRAKIEV